MEYWFRITICLGLNVGCPLQGIHLHMSQTCLADFVLHTEFQRLVLHTNFQRLGGTYLPYLTQSVKLELDLGAGAHVIAPDVV